MTKEQAARILDPETRLEALDEIEYYAGFNGEKAKLEAIDEVLRIAARVLRNTALSDQEAWVSIEERMPDDNERVIAYRPNEADVSAYKYCVMWGWSVKTSTKHRGITHWMPLPDPPYEQEMLDRRRNKSGAVYEPGLQT